MAHFDVMNVSYNEMFFMRCFIFTGLFRLVKSQSFLYDYGLINGSRSLKS